MHKGWKATLDAAFEAMTANGKLDVPGLVVCARRGNCTYHKAFGLADKEKATPMPLDAQMRCFSMTKVLTAAVASMLEETGTLDFDAPVSKYIPSFGKRQDVLANAQTASKKCPTPTMIEMGTDEIDEVEYTSFLTGETTTLHFTRRPAARTLRVRHCLGEASGLGYDQWADRDLWLPGSELGLEYGAATALRGAAGYSSNCIIGQDSSLAECARAPSSDALAAPGPTHPPLHAQVLRRNRRGGRLRARARHLLVRPRRPARRAHRGGGV